MNIREEAKRMQRAGLLLIALCCTTAYLGVWLEKRRGIELLFSILGPGVVLGLAGSITKGFAQDAH